MPRKKKAEPIIPIIERVNITPAITHVPIPAGHVLLVALDDEGNEKGRPFHVAERGYLRIYNDPTKFKLLQSKSIISHAQINTGTSPGAFKGSGCSSCGNR
jgi:hypothetical protein